MLMTITWHMCPVCTPMHDPLLFRACGGRAEARGGSCWKGPPRSHTRPAIVSHARRPQPKQASALPYTPRYCFMHAEAVRRLAEARFERGLRAPIHAPLLFRTHGGRSRPETIYYFNTSRTRPPRLGRTEHKHPRILVRRRSQVGAVSYYFIVLTNVMCHSIRSESDRIGLVHDVC